MSTRVQQKKQQISVSITPEISFDYIFDDNNSNNYNSRDNININNFEIDLGKSNSDFIEASINNDYRTNYNDGDNNLLFVREDDDVVNSDKNNIQNNINNYNDENVNSDFSSVAISNLDSDSEAEVEVSSDCIQASSDDESSVVISAYSSSEVENNSQTSYNNNNNNNNNNSNNDNDNDVSGEENNNSESSVVVSSFDSDHEVEVRREKS